MFIRTLCGFAVLLFTACSTVQQDRESNRSPFDKFRAEYVCPDKKTISKICDCLRPVRSNTNC